MSSASLKLEDNRLWKESCDLAEHVYARLSDFPEDEKWYSALKLRSATVDFMYYVSLAAGNPSPIGQEFDWTNARKYAAALFTMYRFAGRQKFIELEPEIMVRINKLLAEIDTAIADTHEKSEAL